MVISHCLFVTIDIGTACRQFFFHADGKFCMNQLHRCVLVRKIKHLHLPKTMFSGGLLISSQTDVLLELD